MPYWLDLTPGTPSYQAMIRSDFDEVPLVMHDTCAEKIVGRSSDFHHYALRHQFAALAGQRYKLVWDVFYTYDENTAPPCYLCDRPVTGPDTPRPPDDQIRLGPPGLRRLAAAAADDSWRPDFDGAEALFELELVMDLVDLGLLDKRYRITEAGRECLRQHQLHAFCLHEISCGRTLDPQPPPATLIGDFRPAAQRRRPRRPRATPVPASTATSNVDTSSWTTT